MEKITKQQAEAALANYRTAKSAKSKFEAQMAETEAIVEAYGKQQVADFVDGRLTMASGTIAIKAGVAKPIGKDGKPLTSAQRAELADLLPMRYVKRTCDFTVLYGTPDKDARRVLNAQGVSVVREDKFTII